MTTPTNSTRPRHIVLTGASRGLGLAMTTAFIEHGHCVHGCSRSEQAVKSLQQRFGTKHSFHVADVAVEESVRRWASAVMSSDLEIDLVINNAAVINRNARLWELAAAEFDEVVDVNIKGVANVIRHFIPPMIARARGVIVNFSSGWGRSVSPEVAPYCASKWAIEGLTKALADELPYGMAAVPLNPGVIDTDMLRSCFGGDAATYPTPEQWAVKAAPFLLSLGPGHNGQSLSVKL